MERRILTDQLLLDVIRIVLIDIKNDQNLRVFRRDLSAELASDRAAAARDEHYFIPHILGYRVDIDLHRLSAQKVLNLHRTELLDRRLARDELIHTGQDLQRCPGLLTDLQNLTDLPFRRTRDCHDDLIDVIGLRHLNDLLSSAEHLDSVNIGPLLCLVIIYDTADIGIEPVGIDQLADDQIAGLSGTDDQGVTHPGPVRPRAIQKSYHAVGKTYRQRK